MVFTFPKFRKRFDSVEFNFMFKTLEKFKFGDKIYCTMKLLCKKLIFKMKNNGWISNSFEMKRVMRQGCSVSALWFIFVVEIRAI